MPACAPALTPLPLPPFLASPQEGDRAFYDLDTGVKLANKGQYQLEFKNRYYDPDKKGEVTESSNWPGTGDYSF